MTAVLRNTLIGSLLHLSVWASAPVAMAQAGGSLTVVSLAEARRRALAVDPAAVAARAGVATASWERRAAVADLFTPNLSATTTYVRYNDLFFSFTGEPSSTIATASAEARYSLLGGGKIAELRRANASVAAAEAGETASRFRAALATDAAYYAVLAEGELARVAADRLRRAQEQLGVARSRVLAGDAIATDSLQLLLEVNRARLEVVRRDSALTVARLRLGRQIGLAGPADAAPIDSAPPPALPLSLGEASAELRERGPEVEAARAAERQASAAVGAQRAEYLPDITLGFASSAYDATFFPSFLRRNSIALTVSLPIWDAGRREVAFARARAQRDAAQAAREDAERASAERMAEAYHGYQTARAALELARVGVEASAETYRVQGARYREGSTTILDLLEAQVALGEAEASLIQARYSAWWALAQIEALLGRRLFADTQ
jgi:multidrug efflux system outer membrane protein